MGKAGARGGSVVGRQPRIGRVPSIRRHFSVSEGVPVLEEGPDIPLAPKDWKIPSLQGCVTERAPGLPFLPFGGLMEHYRQQNLRVMQCQCLVYPCLWGGGGGIGPEVTCCAWGKRGEVISGTGLEQMFNEDS